MKETCAVRLKKAMDLRNMKPVELVEKSGVKKSALSQYMSGKIIPRQNSLYELAKALDVSEAWLMGYDVPLERSSSLNNKEKTNSTLHMYRIDTRGLNKDDIAEFEKELDKYAEFLKSQILKKKEK